MPTPARTPARAQYLELKRQHPDALLLFRMGDFYETFDDDAEVVSATLGIALTSRPMGRDEGRIPLAGIPYHALDRYLDRLIQAGHRVAICEQVSPPGKGLVERRIVRVVTPGTVDAGALVEERAHNWLVALVPPSRPGEAAALAACDVTTGELECRLVSAADLAGEWARLSPREALLPEDAEAPSALGAALLDRRPAREFDPVRGARTLEEHFEVASVEAFGLDARGAVTGAAGALLERLRALWPEALAHLRSPRLVPAQAEVAIDASTRRSLELFTPGRSGESALADLLDGTATPMGGRLLRDWLGRPSREAARIEARLDRVQALVEDGAARDALRAALRGVPDLERLLGRVRAGTATAKQLVTLRLGIERLPAVAAATRAHEALARVAEALGAADEAGQLIAAAIADEPAEPGEGALARAGFDPAIDELRVLATDARSALAALEAAERTRSGIASLKVGYHRVFGYYLEAPRGQADRAPADYEPRQTLANAQRFRSPALSELETRILEARERLEAAERELLDRVRAQVAAAGRGIERAAEAVARLDVAAAVAQQAVEHGYVRPELAEGGPLVIEAGRHPAVERRLERGAFVPNDLELGAGADLVILTGPNMGGKSTYLRQVALIVLLAQSGWYVPADRARIPLVDRLCSRVGAQDDLAAGQSTFMVEMLETAAILHQATERSLVILDEIGRGTSTDDGLAIARAVVEHLHHRRGGTPRTLFATHYHELTALAATLPRVANASVAVAERGQEVVFLHRIVEGGADRSYGVHVAALAGLPRAVVDRARELLHQAEAARGLEAPRSTRETAAQLPLGALAAAAPDPLLEDLATLEPDALSPLEALQRLYELRREARDRLGIEG
ncbi:MAG: DNA mismatch repair protein MutS [Dehalococcoidia bacterium]